MYFLPGLAAALLLTVLWVHAHEPAGRDPALQAAMNLGKEGKFAEAIEAAERIVQQKKGAPDKYIHVFLGLMYYKTKQLDNALNEFSYTLVLDKNSPMAYYFLGLTFEAKALASTDVTAIRLMKRKALESWQNYMKFSVLRKHAPEYHRNIGISVQKSHESAEKHIKVLKEALGDENI
jgi:tetratricopeptide (TPR) repeat protein